MSVRFRTGSEEAQEALGKRLSAACKAPCVIYLQGDLGVGKTTLVRGFLRGLGHKGVVKSPTYTLIEPYPLPGCPCYHLDLYRVADPGELEYLGLRDMLGDDAVLLVEWPERGLAGLPDADLRIRITYAEEGRELSLEAGTGTGREVLARMSHQADPLQ